MTYPKMGYEKLPNDCADRDAGEKGSIGIGWPQTELTASLIPGILRSWEQRCSSFRGSQHPLRSLFWKKQIPGPPSRVSDSAVLGWGLQICIPNKFPGVAGGMQLVGASFENHQFTRNTLGIILPAGPSRWPQEQHRQEVKDPQAGEGKTHHLGHPKLVLSEEFRGPGRHRRHWKTECWKITKTQRTVPLKRQTLSIKRTQRRASPHDPLVKILRFHCTGCRFDPWLEKFHIPPSAAKKIIIIHLGLPWQFGD